MNFVIYFILTCELSIWQGSFSYKDVISCFENFIVLQGSLMACNIIFKCGKNSLMFKILFLQGFLIHPIYTRKEGMMVFIDIFISLF